MEEKGERKNLTVSRGRDLGFLSYVVPVCMTSALLVAPRSVIVPHSSLVSEGREGQCNPTVHVPALFSQPPEDTEHQINTSKSPEAHWWGYGAQARLSALVTVSPSERTRS